MASAHPAGQRRGATGVCNVQSSADRAGRACQAGECCGSADTAGQTFWTEIRAAWRRHRSRQSIAGLDDHLLKDIGVSFAEAEAEANKPFWPA